MGNFDVIGRVKPSIDTSAPWEMAVTVKSLELLPPAAVTVSLPAPNGALAGTDVVMDVVLLTVTFAITPPIVTVAPVNPVPLTVTAVPAGPDGTEIEVMTGRTNGGGAVTEKAE